LIAPGLPQVAEKALMRKKVNGYGKTWHVWMTGTGDNLPLAAPQLAWSFNRDGEVREELITRRDQRMGIQTSHFRAGRQDLTPIARPQSGVDQLKPGFGSSTMAIEGVAEAK
jgi:hypothetical protein